ncbi:TIGR03745 family integrating conjugative element membrane protein, partial [Salmonella enterica subsp. enterica serovar Derby]|nr:TIGR03745 family integrating conjugative element membrane protein [Salmonella enterica subsp. enterica serovar Derby]
MYHFASVATRVRRGIDRVINRTFTLALLVWLTC